MKSRIDRPKILMVDDDAADIYLTKRAFSKQRDGLIFAGVQNSAELFDYLYCKGLYSDNSASDIPDIILLDVNIPKENGFEILVRLRTDEKFGHLPICMLTTSAAPHDVQKAYKLGANSYLTKSVSASGMKEIAEDFCRYWFDFVKIP